jgi:hypothetical protein
LTVRPLSELRLGPLLQQLTEISVRHRVRLPSTLTLIGKAFGQMQLDAAERDPSLDPFAVAEGFYLRQLLGRMRTLANSAAFDTVLADARGRRGRARSRGRQCDLVLLDAWLAPDKVGAYVAQEPGHCHVLARDQRGEAANAFGPGTVRQLAQQLGAQSAALPVIDDSDGDFSGLRVFGVPDVAGYAHAAPVRGIQRAKCLVVMVVDLGEVAQLRRGQFLLWRQEPQLAGLGAQPGEAIGQELGVSAPDLPDEHL